MTYENKNHLQEYHQGYTNKEMLGLILAKLEQTNMRIDELHEKTNSKVDRQELFAWATILTLLITGLFQFLKNII